MRRHVQFLSPLTGTRSKEPIHSGGEVADLGSERDLDLLEILPERLLDGAEIRSYLSLYGVDIVAQILDLHSGVVDVLLHSIHHLLLVREELGLVDLLRL